MIYFIVQKRSYRTVNKSIVSAASLLVIAFSLQAQPCDTYAFPCARRLMQFLTDTSGQSVITGQMDSISDDSVDMADRIYKSTGKYPALMGYDFMNMRSSMQNGTRQTEEAASWWARGGIVLFTHHWRDPTDRNRETASPYAKDTMFRIPYDTAAGKWRSAENGYKEHRAYDAMMSDLYRIAEKLLVFQMNAVPVIWMPLPEADSGLYWWSADGPEAYKALYRLIYVFFTKTEGIHNLVWVWSGQKTAWYPGDDYADVVGCDISDVPRYYGSQYSLYLAAQKTGKTRSGGRKLCAVTMCSVIPSPDAAVADKAAWSWFMLRSDSGADAKRNYWSGEYYNESSHKRAVYASRYAVTLDRVPDLRTYTVK